MNRIRKILYEAARIVLVGVLVALCITAVWRYTHRPTLVAFKTAYSDKSMRTQVAVADAYLNYYSPAELNGAIEEQNAEGFCHSQAHALGRAVYKKYPNLTDAIRQCGTMCTYGCFHGVLMEMFSTDSDTLGGAIQEDSPDAYLAYIEDSAQNLCARPEVASEVRARYCYHGVGHVFAFVARTDLDKGLAACNIYTNEHALLYCRSGVFMEYLFSPASGSILNTKGLEPCDAYPDDQGKCFRYKAYGWLKVWGSIAAALKGCESFGRLELRCISNVAEAYATPLLLSTKDGIESMCGTLSGEKKETCVDGAINKIIDLNNGDDSERVCDVVANDYRERCLDVRARSGEDAYF